MPKTLIYLGPYDQQVTLDEGLIFFKDVPLANVPDGLADALLARANKDFVEASVAPSPQSRGGN